ncbi:MAG: DNA/RNA non-specific endonuclease [Luteibaculaceae bacterium]
MLAFLSARNYLLTVATTFLFSATLFAQNIETTIKQKEDSITFYKQRQVTLNNQLEDLKLNKIIEDIQVVGLPKDKVDGEIVTHSAMVLKYVESHEQALWVQHIIIPDVAEGRTGRTNDFRPDPKVSTGSAVEEDYFLKYMKPDSSGYKYDGFGFDRGHLAPSADFRWSPKALSESYYYSNMSPQRAAFNRGKWAELEDFYRDYVIRNKVPLHVVTVVKLHDSLPRVKRSVNQVSIPEFYGKAAYDPVNNRVSAFIMPNTSLNEPVEWYSITLDSLERYTGVNFFPNVKITEKQKKNIEINPWLPDKQQKEILPLAKNRLPKGAVSTRDIYELAQSGLGYDKKQKFTVCGTVVSAYKSGKGNVFLNLDKAFPNTVFSVSIFEKQMQNFTYQPEEYLIGKAICVTGIIQEYQDKPGIYPNREKDIIILEEL